MTRRFTLMARKLAPIVTAGLLLQAGGCSVDLANLASGLVTSIFSSFISSLVFGGFNLV